MPIKLNDLHNYSTRLASKSNFYSPNIQTNAGKSLSAFAGPQIWSEVPSGMKSLPRHKFKKAYQKVLLEVYIK